MTGERTESTAELVEWLLLNDVQLGTDGTDLRYDGPREVPREEYVERLRAHKRELIEWLAHPDGAGVLSRHPLSYFQLRMWTRHTEHPDPSVYNVRWEVELDGPLRPKALADALTALVARHEALRTRFVRRGGHPVAEVMEPTAVPLPVIAPGDPRLSTVDTAFDLTQAPLVRAVLVRKDSTAWTLLLVVHHLACDHTTLGILLAELSALYDGHRLPGRPTRFADFARWERGTLADPAQRERLLGHWRTTLDGAELRPPLPTDRPRPAVRSGRGAEHRFALGPAAVHAVDATARRYGGTRYTVLCAAFARLLHELTGRDDVVVITSSTGRTRREDERTVGVFTDALPLRVHRHDGVEQVGHQVFAALDHRPMPLAVLAEELDEAGGPPLPTVLFTVLGGDPPVPRFTGVTASAVPGPPATVARMDLYLTVLPHDGGLIGAAEYATDLFDVTTVERWCTRFTELLTDDISAALEQGEEFLTELPGTTGL